MKKLYTLIAFSLIALGVNAQQSFPLTFENGYADTVWNVFENGAEGSNEDISVILNPFSFFPNESDSILQFVVHDDSRTWVGMYTDSTEVMLLSEESHTMYMMVYKSIISPLRIKLERSLTDGEDFSVIVDNTLTDEWELLTFDMSFGIPHYYQRLTIFPDFPETRELGTTVYIDNIANAEMNTSVFEQSSGESLKIFPNPVSNRMSVQYPEMKGLTVSDILGKTVKSFTFQKTNSKIVELGDLQTGLYFVTAETVTGNYTGSFLKK